MRKIIVLLNMTLLLVACLTARASEPSVTMTTSFGMNADDTAVTCKHHPKGTFTVQLENEPDSRSEIIIEGPKFRWFISPTANVSFSPIDQKTVDVVLSDAAFGKSYNVTVQVSWLVWQPVLGIVNYFASDRMTLAAIKLVDFKVVSDNPGTEELTDNREATATITAEGIATPSGLSFAFTATPVEGNPINKPMSTAIRFTPTDNSLVYRTSTIYWYGTASECCESYHHAYQFDLTMNGCCKVTKSYKVGWPNEKIPEFEWKVANKSSSVIRPAELIPGTTDEYRCEIVFGDFEKTGDIYGFPASNQYAADIMKEEERHKAQWLTSLSEAEGGQGDCFTAKGLQFNSFFKDTVGPCYGKGSTPEEATADARWWLGKAEDEERRMSKSITFVGDLGFKELKAKEFVGYNAAFKYHCIYEHDFNYGPNPQNCHHPAYPVSP